MYNLICYSNHSSCRTKWFGRISIRTESWETNCLLLNTSVPLTVIVAIARKGISKFKKNYVWTCMTPPRSFVNVIPKNNHWVQSRICVGWYPSRWVSCLMPKKLSRTCSSLLFPLQFKSSQAYSFHLLFWNDSAWPHVRSIFLLLFGILISGHFVALHRRWNHNSVVAITVVSAFWAWSTCMSNISCIRHNGAFTKVLWNV